MPVRPFRPGGVDRTVSSARPAATAPRATRREQPKGAGALRLRVAVGAVGAMLAIAGIVALSPLLCLIAYPSESQYASPFLATAAALIAAGGVCWSAFPRGGGRFSMIDGASVVVVSWVLVCLASAYPLWRIDHLTFTQSVFEAVSGWTTTGLSVVDVEKAPHILLLWRSVMQLAGGAGLAIIMLGAFSLPVGAGLYRAEGRSDQLVPHVIRSTKLVLVLYTVYAALGVAAYLAAGMSPFDAVNHSFAAVSTGGFSTRADSIGAWDSPAVEAVSLPLMILGNMNFLTAWVLFRGKLRAFTKNGEIRLLFVAVLVCVTAIFMLVTRGLYTPLSKAVRVAVFDTVSAVTTTGFSTESYNNWPPAGIFIFIVLMLIGGGTCSTAGGIKQFRVYLLLRSILWDLRKMLLPKDAVIENSIWQGDERVFVRPQAIQSVGTFVFLYLSLFALGSFVISAFGYSLPDALFEFASALGTVGLSVGVTSATTPVPVLWVETAGMLLGRLEILVVFLFFAQIAQKTRRLTRA